MDLIQLLYDIPVLGVVLQFAGYMIDVLPTIAPIILRAATPIAFAALCGVMCERSGVVNIGIEGTMLAAAFVGWYVGVLMGGSTGPDHADLRGHASPPHRGRAGNRSPASSSRCSTHGLSISVRADQIISGTIINILAFGMTGYLISLISQDVPDRRRRVYPFRSTRRARRACHWSAGSSRCSSPRVRSRCR